MPELQELVLDAVRRRGASYADVRFTERKDETVRVKNGSVEAVTAMESAGFGVRVLFDGAWGFCASSKATEEEAVRVAEEAVAIARAGAGKRQEAAELAPVKPVRDTYRTPVRKDPFQVKLEDRIAHLVEAERLLHAGGPIRVGEAEVSVRRERKRFYSTEGSAIDQEITQAGGGMSATAIGNGEMQRRGYPNAHRGHFASRGWEFIEEMDLAGHAERVGREAFELLSARQCPSGRSDVILDGRQLALQIHESCGHPVELDRALGTEASLAGTSFLTPDKLGAFQYGSPEVNIVADATIEGGLGTFGYDDEGVPARRTMVIDHGRFVSYLTSRETAAKFGQESNGTMRADGWSRQPIIRMTNINLLPGDWDLDELIRDTKEGLYLEINRSWSIDDKRLNFQFGTEVGWEIKDGALGAMVKNPTYTGITPEFWNSCDAVADGRSWNLWGTPNCGKGEPGQVARVGHGAAPARFRNVRVGVGRW
ncbi:MAG: TldD/PmbA family protein [Bacillota bacterium]